MNKKIKNIIINWTIIIAIVLAIALPIKASMHKDDEIIARLEPYVGVSLSDSYDDVIAIMESTTYGYEFIYGSHTTVQVEKEKFDDQNWMSKQEITSFWISKHKVHFSVDMLGMKDYREAVSNL